MVKEKRVSWADSNVINSEVAGMKEEVSVKEGELDNGEVEDEDEDEDEDGGNEREENEAPNFELPYAADEYDDDDGYDEYQLYLQSLQGTVNDIITQLDDAALVCSIIEDKVFILVLFKNTNNYSSIAINGGPKGLFIVNE